MSRSALLTTPPIFGPAASTKGRALLGREELDFWLATREAGAADCPTVRPLPRALDRHNGVLLAHGCAAPRMRRVLRPKLKAQRRPLAL